MRGARLRDLTRAQLSGGRFAHRSDATGARSHRYASVYSAQVDRLPTAARAGAYSLGRDLPDHARNSASPAGACQAKRNFQRSRARRRSIRRQRRISGSPDRVVATNTDDAQRDRWRPSDAVASGGDEGCLAAPGSPGPSGLRPAMVVPGHSSLAKRRGH